AFADNPPFQLQLHGTNRCLQAMQTTDPATAVRITRMRTNVCQSTNDFLVDVSNTSNTVIRFKISPTLFRCLHVDVPANPHNIKIPTPVTSNDCGQGLTFWSLTDHITIRDDNLDSAGITGLCLEEIADDGVDLGVCGDGVAAQKWDRVTPQ